MKITMICAALPPQLDGLGDYTAQLAAELVQRNRVTVLTCEGEQHKSIPGVKIVPAFRPDLPGSCVRLLPFIEAEAPDWVVLQYQPFAYGKWGRNLYLPHVMAQMKRQMPVVRQAVMVHEPFVPIEDWKRAIMTTWQRWQLWQLGHSADVVFFSIDPWAQRFRRWFPGKPVLHLPVGANIPRVAVSRSGGTRPVGNIGRISGSRHFWHGACPSRLLNYAYDAVVAVRNSGRQVVVLYMGPHGQTVQQVMGDIPLIAEGPLDAEEISRRFAAVDIYLAPFDDGISTRRGSLMAALQHGVATVGTCGSRTDTLLKQEDGSAFLLAEAHSSDEFCAHTLRLAQSADLRRQIGTQGQRLYETRFAWPQIAKQMLSAFTDHASISARKML